MIWRVRSYSNLGCQNLMSVRDSCSNSQVRGDDYNTVAFVLILLERDNECHVARLARDPATRDASRSVGTQLLVVQRHGPLRANIEPRSTVQYHQTVQLSNTASGHRPVVRHGAQNVVKPIAFLLLEQ